MMIAQHRELIALRSCWGSPATVNGEQLQSTVMRYTWDPFDATVACRQMGFMGVSDIDSSLSIWSIFSAHLPG